MKVGDVVGIPLCAIGSAALKGMDPFGLAYSFFHCYVKFKSYTVVTGAVIGASGGLLYGLAEGVYLAFWIEGDIVVYEFVFVKNAR